MAPIIDGNPVNGSYTNSQLLDAVNDDTALGKITLANTDPVSGATVDSTQQEHNSAASFMGKAINEAADVLPDYGNNDVGAPNDPLFDRVDTLTGRFNSTAGHTHDGTTGEGPNIVASTLANVPYRGYVLQGANKLGITGSSMNVTTNMTGYTPGGSPTVVGVVTDTPWNKVLLRRATGASAGDSFLDASGNIVYGRITYAATVWTVSFYVDISGTETAYSFASSVDIAWYFQHIYNPMVSVPTYSEFAITPSDNSTADVITATTTLQGKVSLGTAAQSVGASNSAGTANAAVANADHAHQGVHSVSKSGSTALFGDVTLTASGGSSLTQASQNIDVSSPALASTAPGAITSASATGTGTTSARADHTHEGLHSIAKSGSTALVGDVTLTASGGASLTQASQNIDVSAPALASTAPGIIASASATGTGTTSARADHTHEGVHSISKSGSAQIKGDVTLTAGTNITLTQSVSDITIASTASGGGSKNYIVNPNFNGGVTTNWSINTLTVDATTKAVSGNVTTGAASITTFAASATTPLEGAFSLSVGGTIAAGAAFLSDAFAIDREDQAKVQSFSFAYEAVSGTMNFSGTSANTWAVWIAEVTTATPNTVVSWIQPAGVYNLVQSSGVGIATGTFQTTATGTAYRLAVVCINAAGVATSMRFDDFKLGPQVQVMAPAMSDWTSYTTTLNSNTNVSASSAQYRKIGDSIQIQVSTSYSGAGDASQYSFTVPSGLSIDTSKLANTTASSPIIGVANKYSANYRIWEAVYFNSTTIRLIQDNATGYVVSSSFVAGDIIYTTVTVPVAGFSANTVSSSDTDTRVIASSARKSGNQSISAAGNVLVTFGVVDFDNSGSFASSRFTAPVSGVYAIDANLSIFATAAGQSADAIIYLNGSEYTRSRITFGSSGVSSVFVAKNIVMKAGDYVEIFSGASTTLNIDGTNNGGWNYFNVRRLSGPAVVQASESVAMTAINGTTAFTSGVQATAIFTTKQFDTHNAYNAGTGIYTVPVSGKYQVSGAIRLQASTNPYVIMNLFLYKNGSNVLANGAYSSVASAELTFPAFHTILTCNAGDTILLQAVHNDGGAAKSMTNNLFNWISIARIGN